MAGSKIRKMMNRVGTSVAFQTPSENGGVGIDNNPSWPSCLENQNGEA
jgi:hypothetical protein